MSNPRRLRVGVVQLDTLPDVSLQERSPLEDPFFSGDYSSFAKITLQNQGLEAELAALRRRVRQVYCWHLSRKIRRVLEVCRAWNVEVLVFPEYSIPWEVLAELPVPAGMTVIAGTHSVTRASIDASTYAALPPDLRSQIKPGCSIAPILQAGRMTHAQTKLTRSQWERYMVPGAAWSPVTIAGTELTVGVLICIDFLHRESDSHRELVGPRLRTCALLAVPSYTPAHSIPEFNAQSAVEARRYERPVLYADASIGGGTSIRFDSGSAVPEFPEGSGALTQGEEGVIVGDLDLEKVSLGPSTRFETRDLFTSFAFASFVYTFRLEDREYDGQVAPLVTSLEGQSGDGLDESAVTALEQMSQLKPGKYYPAGRISRLRQLHARLSRVDTSTSALRYLREVTFPPDVLPPYQLTAALASGALSKVVEWTQTTDTASLTELSTLLSAAGHIVSQESEGWSREGQDAYAAIVRRVGSLPEDLNRGVQVPVARPERASVLERKVVGVGLTIYFESSVSELRSRCSRLGLLSPPSFWPDFEKIQLLAATRHGSAIEFAIAMYERAALPIVVVELGDGARTVYAYNSDSALPAPQADAVATALDASRGGASRVVALGPTDILQCAATLAPRFKGAASAIKELRDHHLNDVGGCFVDPKLRTIRPTEQSEVDASAEWQGWLGSTGPKHLLMVGEFGSGKSTLVAQYAVTYADAACAAVIVPLFGLGERDPMSALLQYTRLEDTEENRAAASLLLRLGMLFVCFDGFDEMLKHVTHDEMVARLVALYALGGPAAKIMVTSRSNYFRDHAEMLAMLDQVASATGTTVDVVELRPFDSAEVRQLVTRLRPKSAAEILHRIENSPSLRDLSTRPLLLSLIIASVEDLPVDAAVTRADLYEAYLHKWLSHTDTDPSGDEHPASEIFSREQKSNFAESLALALWTQDRHSLPFSEYQRSAKSHLLPEVEDMTTTVESVIREAIGGLFFVGDARGEFRFAHRSFGEYFLSKALAVRLAAPTVAPGALLCGARLTPEMLAFFGEVLETRATVEPVCEALAQFLGARFAPPEETVAGFNVPVASRTNAGASGNRMG